jgi:branched-chain amino acid transport system permease protein
MAWALGAFVLVSGVAFLALAPQSGLQSLTFYFLLVKFFVLAQSFNLIAGYVGYLSFGHVAFYGLGGYVTAVLVWKFSLPFHPALLLGGLGAAVMATLLGHPILRLRGAYFAIATLALNEALRVIILNIPEQYGGGSFGLPVPRIRDPWMGYYWMLGLAVGVLLLTWGLVRSRYGVLLRAVREDEEAARALGINTVGLKVGTFAVSAFFMGLAGGVDLQVTGYIYPEAAFNIDTNVMIIAMTMLGGSGTVLGPPLGVVILYLLQDYAWARAPFSHLIVLGGVLAFLVLFLRRGILGLLEEKIPALRGRIR